MVELLLPTPGHIKDISIPSYMVDAIIPFLSGLYGPDENNLFVDKIT